MALAVLQFASTTLSSALPVSSTLETRDEHGIIPFPFDESKIADIETVFATLESVPDSVLNDSDDAIKAWVQAHQSTPPNLTVRNDDDAAVLLEERQLWLQITKCAFEIGKAIAENAFPAAKLRRLIELVKFLGGARKVAKMLLKAKSLRELILIGGPELQELADILLGLNDIAQACFSLF